MSSSRESCFVVSSSRPAKTAIRLSQKRTEQEEEEEGEKFFQVVGPLLTPPSDLLHTITMVYLFRHALAFWVAFFGVLCILLL